MEVLQKMNDILSNTKPTPITAKKKVTFKEPIPEPRVGRRQGDMQQFPNSVLAP
jgi:hypothetical protein